MFLLNTFFTIINLSSTPDHSDTTNTTTAFPTLHSTLLNCTGLDSTGPWICNKIIYYYSFQYKVRYRLSVGSDESFYRSTEDAWFVPSDCTSWKPETSFFLILALPRTASIVSYAHGTRRMTSFCLWCQNPLSSVAARPKHSLPQAT